MMGHPSSCSLQLAHSSTHLDLIESMNQNEVGRML